MTPIDTIRAALEQARELIPEYCGIRTQYDAALADLAELETELSGLRASMVALNAENDQLRAGIKCEYEHTARLAARLASIDEAPAVAVVCSSEYFGAFVQQRLFGSQLPDIGAELIARPEAK